MLKKFKEKLKNKKELYIRVKARPSANQTKIVEILSDDTLKIDIKAAPVKGKANKELVDYLGKVFLVSKENVTIISGARERVKLVKIYANS